MAYLYWIKFKNHKDIFEQGYVGVTTKSVQERFLQHIHCSKYPNHYYTEIGKQLRNHNLKDFEVITIIEATEEYCYEIERVLRPKRYIGWNIVIGGGKPPSSKGKVVSKKTREKQSLLKRGKKLSKEHVDKVVSSRLAKVPWHRKDTDRLVWAKADILFDHWLICKSPFTVSRILRQKPHTVKTMFGWFERGYVPTKDDRWNYEFGKEN